MTRFVRAEVPAFLRSALAMLAPGGLLRTTVRLGLHPVDDALFERGRASGTLERFFDETTQTIDFSKARAELDACLPRHPAVDRSVQLESFASRGCESRFFSGDVENLIAATSLGESRWELIGAVRCRTKPDIVLYTAVKSPRHRSAAS